MSAQNVKKEIGFDWRKLFINPVLNKEITLRMRTLRSMWALFFYLLAIGIGALGFLYITQMDGGRSGFNPDASRTMFMFISMAQLGLIAFMAPGLTAGIVSGERERQTLNLLLTTQQTSANIILSKLAAALAFMVLIVVATMPVYSIVFLYGGISPSQLTMVFLFYLFVMIVFGSLGILFSTLLKRTMISVIVTYGVTLFSFGGTAFIYLILNSIMDNTYRGSANIPDYGWIGYIMGLNPIAALYSVFDSEISRSVFRAGYSSANYQKDAPIELWQEFLIVYTIIAVGAVLLSIRKIRPALKKRSTSAD
ncbi:ABC transporter permease [Cohnella faecalis]|uniref:ABC transporter permease n=1 Tax=Cohnella faecalis TaxID=2315694 RepID=A0A398CQR9_9BACL|nr:ABC transporter permease [Cohnella faecalis]RIE04852.1 ABC transporter permease [Cohnella faecalis]